MRRVLSKEVVRLGHWDNVQGAQQPHRDSVVEESDKERTMMICFGCVEGSLLHHSSASHHFLSPFPDFCSSYRPLSVSRQENFASHLHLIRETVMHVSSREMEERMILWRMARRVLAEVACHMRIHVHA